jgi:flavin-dependent dehydrogenase
VIVGGGPAGAATALFLAAARPQARERILLIDKARFPRQKICAGAIGGRGDRLLATIGVEVDVPSAHVRGLRVAARMGALASRLDGPPVGRVVRRKQFDAALLDQVRDRGVAVREGVALERFERTARGVRIQTNVGEIRAQALVGADGVGSVVRRLIGGPQGGCYAQVVEVDTPWCDADHERDLLCFDVSGRDYPGYAWDFPTVVDGELMVCRGIYQLIRGLPAETARGEQDIANRLARRLEERGLAVNRRAFKRFAERGLPMYQPFSSERVLLVGEAAGIDPVLGEGIPQAIFYGKTAGDYLARCFDRGDYRFGEYRSSVMRSRLGLDLKIRAALVKFVYGFSRPVIERWATSSRHLGAAGISYFAGRRVPRTRLAMAFFDLARAAALGA